MGRRYSVPGTAPVVARNFAFVRLRLCIIRRRSPSLSPDNHLAELTMLLQDHLDVMEVEPFVAHLESLGVVSISFLSSGRWSKFDVQINSRSVGVRWQIRP
ncbi:hypothetical protein FA13DRAFT_1740389 [Coprinellus micaceus]|uniref:Uncharacterized protein n=1 Tax=Coprinellus micaceus TaxID=71717 RepID=A0A4Y7SMZ1_COPMI|nr:hypothetical protein FA13DRAFT_1740389 [Coprinellus micaceus]